MTPLMRAAAGGYVPRGKSPTWTPADFSSVTLVGYYDAEDNTKLTDVGGAASAWTDSANGANSVTQGTAASRPTIVATHSVTGRQVLQFDGTDDQMTSPGACPYAVMGDLSMMVVGVQDALVADTTSRYAVSAGVSTNSGLMVQRVIVGGVASRWATRTGNGAGGSTNNVMSVGDLCEGRFAAIGTWASTTQQALYNGVTNASASAATMFGDTTRFRIGASPAGTPAGFWHGAISAVLYVTGAISAQDLNNFNIWAATRLGLR